VLAMIFTTVTHPLPNDSGSNSEASSVRVRVQGASPSSAPRDPKCSFN